MRHSQSTTEKNQYVQVKLSAGEQNNYTSPCYSSLFAQAITVSNLFESRNSKTHPSPDERAE